MHAGLDATWTAMQARAVERGLRVEIVDEQTVGYDTVTRCRVSSHSQPGQWHHVRVKASAAGVDVACDCYAATLGRPRPCSHAAAALDALGMMPTPEPARHAETDTLDNGRTIAEEIKTLSALKLMAYAFGKDADEDEYQSQIDALKATL